MRALKLFAQSEGTLIADYASRMSETLVRRRADIASRAARVEAELAIKAHSEFLANMNHELRTPLNAIIGFATMLREGEQYGLSEEQRRSYVDYILQSADLLLGHINTLLEVAALESGGVELSDDEFDFGTALDEALDRVRIRAEAANVLLERRDEGGDVAAWGDAERTGQALDHLLQAAIKSCGEGGRVLVRACFDEKGWAEIAVRDDGAGLTEEELSDALGAFKQVHHGLDRSFSGPGIGYAIAKTFIEMQGGRFVIKSRKGQGTLVCIALPPLGEAAQPDPASRKKADKTASAPERFSVERTDDAA